MLYVFLSLLTVGFCAVPQCTEIPAGSTTKNEQGDIITFREPVVAGIQSICSAKMYTPVITPRQVLCGDEQRGAHARGGVRVH